MFSEIGKENLALKDKNMPRVGQNRFHQPVTAVLQWLWPQFPLSSVAFSDPPESLGPTGWKRQAHSIYHSTKFGQISEANGVNLFPRQTDIRSSIIFKHSHWSSLLLYLQLDFILLLTNFLQKFFGIKVFCASRVKNVNTRQLQSKEYRKCKQPEGRINAWNTNLSSLACLSSSLLSK